MNTSPIVPLRSDPKHFLSIDQLSAEALRGLVSDAALVAQGRTVQLPAFSVAMFFLQPSLRTRLGFAEAVHRLGGVSHHISSRREVSEGEAVEGLADTLRVATGMSQMAIVRAEGSLGQNVTMCPSPVVNAGDDLEHPTQALIDLFAIQEVCGPWEELAIGVSGDLQMRSTRSLFKAFQLAPPRRLRLMAPPSRRGDAAALLSSLGDRVEWAAGGDWQGLDALYLSGLPGKRGADVLAADDRALYALTDQNLDRLPARARVFSPMPVIDEITGAARTDPRNAIYRQSDMGVAMRMSVISHVLKTTT